MKQDIEKIRITKAFIPSQPDEKSYVLGGFSNVKKEVLQSNGQWLEFIPTYEKQNKGTETYSCVSFSGLSILEILFKRKFSVSVNKSDRFTAKMDGTQEGGNTLENYAQSIRHDGCVEEEDWMFDDRMSFEEFYAEIPKDIQVKGALWLNDWKPEHEYVVCTPENLMEALKYSPVHVGVQAWWEREGKYYSPSDELPNHATIIVGYVEGEKWLVFDSYEPFIKELEWNFNFSKYGKIYALSKAPKKKENWLMELFKSIIKLFQ